MPVRFLGHAVLKVRNRGRAEAFYQDVLGLPVAARSDELRMTFFTLGRHHDLAILEVGEDAPGADPRGVGLFHVAFNVGDTLDDLRAMKARLDAHGITIQRTADHKVSCSLYVNDPDGNGIELYVDTSDAWRQDPSLIASRLPLAL
jgi:catechol 2,3-dioxygenase